MANTELEKLLAQQDELARKIDDARKKERQPIIDEIKKLIKLHDISAKELGFKPKAAKAAGAEKAGAAALYRNEEGQTWSGRGRMPAWLKDKNGEPSERLKKKHLINQEQE